MIASTAPVDSPPVPGTAGADVIGQEKGTGPRLGPIPADDASVAAGAVPLGNCPRTSVCYMGEELDSRNVTGLLRPDVMSALQSVK